jgi:hypothetical protein
LKATFGLDEVLGYRVQAAEVDQADYGQSLIDVAERSKVVML